MEFIMVLVVIGIIMTIIGGVLLVTYRLLTYLKKNHYCDKVFADG